MNPKETYRELRAVQEKYKNKKTDTFEIRISDMAKDAADTIEALQKQLAPLQGKAVLVMDMPKTCMTCKLRQAHITDYCKISGKESAYKKRRADCPLWIVGGGET
jgi:hypothetical protein